MHLQRTVKYRPPSVPGKLITLPSETPHLPAGPSFYMIAAGKRVGIDGNCFLRC